MTLDTVPLAEEIVQVHFYLTNLHSPLILDCSRARHLDGHQTYIHVVST